MSTQLGEQLIRSLVSGDFATAEILVAKNIEFKGLTPYGLFEADNAEDAFVIFKEWFTPGETIKLLETGNILGRQKLNYVVACRNPENKAKFLFEQSAFYDIADGKVTHLHLVCSGDLSVDTPLATLP